MTVSGSAMRLLADENIEFEVVSLLKDLGHDVMWMVTQAPGTDDAEVPALANWEARIKQCKLIAKKAAKSTQG
jgi:predicted nuclease of predicted toxin-antitoxin system